MKNQFKIFQSVTKINASILVITRMHIIFKNLVDLEGYLLWRSCNTAITSVKSIF